MMMMKLLLMTVITMGRTLIVDASVHCNGTKVQQNREQVAWCIPRGYEKTKPPFLYKPQGEQNMNLHFTFSIREISEVKDSDQVLKIPMYFTVAWEENRLKVDPEHRSWSDDSTGPQDENTEEAETLNHLWRPNLEIYGLEDFNNHKILGEMAGLRITKNRMVKYDTKVTIEISCQMDFTQYPFDKHTCLFQVGSYFYDRNSITCTSKWFDPSKDSDFLVRNLQHHISFRNLSDQRAVVRLTSGDYSACGFEVLLIRKYEPLVYQVYIPCMLFIIISWISFIIDPKVVPGRMSLLVILFLVIINVFNNVKENAPASSSSKLNQIDTYIVFCIFSMFSAIVEYAVVLSIITLRPERKKEAVYNLGVGNGAAAGSVEIRDQGGHHGSQGAQLDSGQAVQDVKPGVREWIMVVVDQPRILDAIAIVCFPSSFLLFNLNYWFIVDYTT